jgi:catechol 2,3-dioxygenase-like lactoylglutathione lyase family enzyme
MAVALVFAGVPVADYPAALGWYERLFGRPPDVIVKEDEAMWQVVDAGWVYVVGDAERAGNGLMAMLVDDFDAYLALLAERGISTGEADTVGGGVRRVVFEDADGNRVTVGEAPTAAGPGPTRTSAAGPP